MTEIIIISAFKLLLFLVAALINNSVFFIYFWNYDALNEAHYVEIPPLSAAIPPHPVSV